MFAKIPFAEAKEAYRYVIAFIPKVKNKKRKRIEDMLRIVW